MTLQRIPSQTTAMKVPASEALMNALRANDLDVPSLADVYRTRPHFLSGILTGDILLGVEGLLVEIETGNYIRKWHCVRDLDEPILTVSVIQQVDSERANLVRGTCKPVIVTRYSH